ncbi:MAG: metallophosphoesterase [Colwellia sp.]|nr:metallophosphoesterase [Colwellia sp.]
MTINKKLLILLLITSIVIILSAFNVFNINVTKTQISSKNSIQNEVSAAFIENDGPYLFVNKNELTATGYWVCKGEVKKDIFPLKSFPKTLNYCGLSAEIVSADVKENNTIEYSGDFKIAAVSDFHGQYSLMKSLLQNNKIIDQQGNWSFADGHFVITGDVFDRGDKVTEILWFLYKLEHQALQAGGQLHLLLGNHEVMILNGDLRYLNPKYTEVAKRLNMPFEQLFSKNSILGNWLRSKPVLVKLNNNLFAHGGFHPSLAKDNHSLEAVNSTFKANLIKAELDSPRKGWGKFLHKSNGPIWYRGYFKAGDEGASSEEIDLLLKHFDINHIIVGHTSQKQIETRYQGRVIAIDSSIKKGEYGEILFIESAKNKDDVMWRGSLDGKKLSLN